MHYTGSLGMELLRKAGHILVGVAIVLLVRAGLLDVWSLGLLTLLYATLMLYNAQFQHGLLTKILSINRADSKIPGLDSLLYAIGCWLVLLLFDQQIAFAAILILAFGDAIAHLVSRSIGRTETRFSRTTYLEGTIAGIVAGTLAAWRFVHLLPALVACTIAMLFEADRLRIGEHHIDDNLVIPLVSAVVLWLIGLALPIA